VVVIRGTRSRRIPNVANGGNHRINKLDRLQAEKARRGFGRAGKAKRATLRAAGSPLTGWNALVTNAVLSRKLRNELCQEAGDYDAEAESKHPREDYHSEKGAIDLLGICQGLSD
jgi:hypothetical protein